VLQAALDYAEALGWALFPVGPDCRVPRCEHGVYDASSDPEVIERLWAACPTANVAMAAGAPSGGVMILDIDCKGFDGFETLAQLEGENRPLPDTWCAATPSGGEHRYFRQPPGFDPCNKVGLRIYNADGSKTVYQGLDVRTSSADGLSRRGSVAVAPSRKPSGPYAWKRDPFSTALADAPSWLLRIVDPPEPPRPPLPPLKITAYDRAARYVAAAIDSECDQLARMAAGSGRNMRLFQASANLGELVGAKLLSQEMAERALGEAARDCGLIKEDGPHSVRATISSGIRKGMQSPRRIEA
jgi:putative DNA primase/helicase